MARIDDDGADARRKQAAKEADRRAAEQRKETQRAADRAATGRQFAAALDRRTEAERARQPKEAKEAKRQGRAQDNRAVARGKAARESKETLMVRDENAETEVSQDIDHAVAGVAADEHGDKRSQTEHREEQRATDRRDEIAKETKESQQGQPQGKVGRTGKSSNEQQGGGEKDKGDEQPQSFKVPPSILMQAPPLRQPVANQPPGSRTVAQRLIDQIVERVRVGVNRAGVPEFQIDMKADILGGVMIRLSCKRGHVTAEFRGARAVLKQIEREEQNLREALEKKGLVLDALKLEES